MNKAVQHPIQSRDSAGTAEKPAIHARNEGTLNSGVVWQPRPNDGKKALLLSERETVFDRPAAALAKADPIDEIADPLWNHHGFKTWTPDLVHCRLLVCGQTIFKLPSGLRKKYVASEMANAAISELNADKPRLGALPAEISLLDWTWPRLIRPIEHYTLQRILMAAAFGGSLDQIATTLSKSGIRISKPTVGRWYNAEKLRIAADWQQLLQPVDSLTVKQWGLVFPKGQK